MLDSVAAWRSSAVVAACSPHVQRRPASVQKLLLAATALPKLDPDLVVEASPEDLALPGDSSAVGLLVGGHYPVSTLWYGLLLQSGNDAANALAPRLVASYNGNDIRIVKVEGAFVWHVHEDTDDFFLVLDGVLDIARADRRKGRIGLFDGSRRLGSFQQMGPELWQLR